MPLPPGSGPITGRPLRNEGWIVRYEVRSSRPLKLSQLKAQTFAAQYKMATFAEFRMETELARKSVTRRLAVE